MAFDRVPVGAWGWRSTLLVVAILVTPQLLVLQLIPETRRLTEAAQVNDLLAYPMMLGAALCLYIYWHLVGLSSATWLVAAAILFSVQGLAYAALRMAHEQQVRTSPGWHLIIEQAVALIILAMVAQASRGPAPTDPLTIGLSLGLLISGLRVLMSEVAPQFALDGQLLVLMAACFLVANLVTAVLLMRVVEPPRWARQRFALAIALLAISRTITYPTPRGDVRSVIAIVAELGGVFLITGTAVALVRVTIGEHRRWVGSLHDQLARVEAGLRVDRARLHEVGSTIAGIASASRLMHDVARVSPARRRKLEQTIESEMARLERLMSSRVGGPLLPVELDGTLEPVVVAHQARGQECLWEPSGHWAHGRADDIAEVVNILLENAAEHAKGTAVRVGVRRVSDTVRICVSDSGPGVPDTVQHRIFEWGARGDGSSGQGIGLHVAHRLVADQGGALSMARAAARGATFVVTLPAEASPGVRSHDPQDPPA
ncbi:sensor histidine kinase [Nocardioides sp.]|jgi:signal transduction histidine kinase|uniref:sensor histidine kinase n=1 Tax=Nocardioides sp. TaxID=35761 RepID=UPI0031FE4B20|nr:hypothetical protein [Nocardioides sp.]